MPSPRIFSTPRPAKDLRFGPLALSALADENRLLEKRETTNNEQQNSISRLRRSDGVWLFLHRLLSCIAEKVESS